LRSFWGLMKKTSDPTNFMFIREKMMFAEIIRCPAASYMKYPEHLLIIDDKNNICYIPPLFQRIFHGGHGYPPYQNR